MPPQDKYKECLVKQNEKKARLLQEEQQQLFKPKINIHSEQILKNLETAQPRKPSPNERLLSTLEGLADRDFGAIAASKHTAIPIKQPRPDTSKSFRRKKRQADLSKSKSKNRDSKSRRRLLADYAIDAGANSASSPRLRKLTTEEIIKLDFRKSIEKVTKGS